MHRRHPLRPLLTSWERARSVRRRKWRGSHRDEVSQQLAAILAEPPSAQLIDLVHERSEGNAFLVEELTSVVSAGGDPPGLPPSLRDVLLARVDGLATGAAGGAHGVRRRSGGPRPAARGRAELAGPICSAALREAVEHQLLVVGPGRSGVRVPAPLARDAVYEDMLPGERVAMHAAFGAALADHRSCRRRIRARLRRLRTTVCGAGPAAGAGRLGGGRRAGLAAVRPGLSAAPLERALEVGPQVSMPPPQPA